MPCCQSGKDVNSNADENHCQALPEHKPHDFAGTGSRRDAHAHFRYTLRSSFVAQRYHRINARCAPRWHIGRKESDGNH
jgi:hypothetical protein